MAARKEHFDNLAFVALERNILKELPRRVARNSVTRPSYIARQFRRVRPPILRPLSCEGGGGLRETASERKGEATAPAIASERATAFLALVLMARIISKIFRAVL